MSAATKLCRRQQPRIERAIQVRFSVNGGPEQSSDTINFTYRSLAIRSGARVAKGDRITAIIDQAPPLEGVVVRAWDDGFAITVTPSALARSVGAVSELGSASPDAISAQSIVGRFTSPAFTLDADHPAWCRIASAATIHAGGRHKLSIVTTAPIETHAIRSLWLSIAQTRWIARVIAVGRRNDQSIMVLRINNWQLQMAAQFGLSMSVILQSLDEWSASAPAAPVLSHVNSLASRERS